MPDIALHASDTGLNKASVLVECKLHGTLNYS